MARTVAPRFAVTFGLLVTAVVCVGVAGSKAAAASSSCTSPPTPTPTSATLFLLAGVACAAGVPFVFLRRSKLWVRVLTAVALAALCLATAFIWAALAGVGCVIG
jgi:peptidoglycan/LPS O-acetylase OafA/YrhL